MHLGVGALAQQVQDVEVREELLLVVLELLLLVEVLLADRLLEHLELVREIDLGLGLLVKVAVLEHAVQLHDGLVLDHRLLPGHLGLVLQGAGRLLVPGLARVRRGLAQPLLVGAGQLGLGAVLVQEGLLDLAHDHLDRRLRKELLLALGVLEALVLADAGDRVVDQLVPPDGPPVQDLVHLLVHLLVDALVQVLELLVDALEDALLPHPVGRLALGRRLLRLGPPVIPRQLEALPRTHLVVEDAEVSRHDDLPLRVVRVLGLLLDAGLVLLGLGRRLLTVAPLLRLVRLELLALDD